MTHLRGHPIEQRAGRWVFSDTGEDTVRTWRNRPCGHCGRHNTPEGHDACLGTIPGVVNACCGHGAPGLAYPQLPDGRRLGGAEMQEWLRSCQGRGQQP